MIATVIIARPHECHRCGGRGRVLGDSPDEHGQVENTYSLSDIVCPRCKGTGLEP